jgi:hypothetical protein
MLRRHTSDALFPPWNRLADHGGSAGTGGSDGRAPMSLCRLRHDVFTHDAIREKIQKAPYGRYHATPGGEHRKHS